MFWSVTKSNVSLVPCVMKNAWPLKQRFRLKAIFHLSLLDFSLLVYPTSYHFLYLHYSSIYHFLWNNRGNCHLSNPIYHELVKWQKSFSIPPSSVRHKFVTNFKLFPSRMKGIHIFWIWARTIFIVSYPKIYCLQEIFSRSFKNLRGHISPAWMWSFKSPLHSSPLKNTWRCLWTYWTENKCHKRGKISLISNSR